MVLAVPRPALAQNNAPDRSADAAAIRAHIESIFQAFVAKDRRKLEETHGAYISARGELVEPRAK